MAARYRIQNHPAFGGLLSKQDLYLLIERGSLARGDICTDTRTGRSHKVGELISGMAPPRFADPHARIERPQYQEIRADAPPEAEPDEYEDDYSTEEEDGDIDELVCHRGHPSWLSYWKALLLVVLLGAAAGLSFRFGDKYLFIGLTLASATLTAAAVARFSRDYIVTVERVEMVWGIFGRSSKEVRICDIRAIDVHETGLLGVLGIGTVDFSSAGNAGVEVQFKQVRGPHQIKEMVRQLQREQEQP